MSGQNSKSQNHQDHLPNMPAIKYLAAKAAQQLDKELMSTGGFSIDQLMELAGLSVAAAVMKLQPKEKGKRILVVAGPGNNGGDGLVASRHLWHFGYEPTVFYPKPTKGDLYERLCVQLHELKIPFVDDMYPAIDNTDHIVDAIFGFSFSGEIREPFPNIISALKSTKTPVLSVDAPSSWTIDNGPPTSGPGEGFMPNALISLTAPKPCVEWFQGRHFLGGRFVPPGIVEKFGLVLPEYPGAEQVG
ncbi:apolipo protein A-I binding protein-like protein [Saitoella complicata NRRL Y-17804]|uniref:apolipo protein A-I binding protein-like protein n=1 Tax=Saitoella complicata (strain BCRC 22490 / CBS 7301 / JCM 7358 / NBRC 10748 / NRRL Y-17804) TaxID=698492 RepID=UPI000867F5FF|nr:apolipo protein A-I binding protein-like protein [Saitoella complicata NRRL Y-17804]ODQ55004.1 apolipo protein A-I binding protein-like protein [Saitoella complicata NRRL Y-17804]